MVAVAGGRLSVEQTGSYIFSSTAGTSDVIIDGSAAGASAHYKVSGALTDE